MNMRIVRCFFAVLVLATPVVAQPFDAERFLLPIAIESQIRGGYGSLWESRLTLVNSGTDSVMFDGIKTSCVFPPCVVPLLRPQATFHAIPYPVANGGPGHFLEVERTRADQVSVQLRIQDVSRQGQTWGTEIPVIRASDALTTTTELMDIPLDPSFRVLVRLYDFEAAAGHSVQVRIFETDPSRFREPAVADRLLTEFPLVIQPPVNLVLNRRPGYAQIDLGNRPELPTSGRVRVEITPLTTGLRFWAFVSVTNNETQHVTTITPQ